MAELVGVGRIVGDHGLIGGRQQGGVSVHVLGALTGQGGASSRGPDDESPGQLVAGRPELVAGALEAEHRVEDVNGDHRLPVSGVAGADHLEQGSRARLIDAGVHDLPGDGLPVGQHHLRIHRSVVLALGVEDLAGGEQRLQPEGA